VRQSGTQRKRIVLIKGYNVATYLGHFVSQRRQQLDRSIEQLAQAVFEGAGDLALDLEAGCGTFDNRVTERLADFLEVPANVLDAISWFDDEWKTREVPMEMPVRAGAGIVVSGQIPEHVRTAAQGETYVRDRSVATGLQMTLFVNKKIAVQYRAGRIESRQMYIPGGERVPLRITRSSAEDDWKFEYGTSEPGRACE